MLRLLRVAVVDELSAAMNSNGAGTRREVGAARLLIASDNAVEKKSEKRILACREATSDQARSVLNVLKVRMMSSKVSETALECGSACNFDLTL